MTVLWFIYWLIQGTPKVHRWNDWLVALAVCCVIDVLGVLNG